MIYDLQYKRTSPGFWGRGQGFLDQKSTDPGIPRDPGIPGSTGNQIKNQNQSRTRADPGKPRTDPGGGDPAAGGTDPRNQSDKAKGTG